MMTAQQDYIEVSDDEDIELLGEYINVEPFVVDLTEDEQKCEESSPSPTPHSSPSSLPCTPPSSPPPQSEPKPEPEPEPDPEPHYQPQFHHQSQHQTQPQPQSQHQTQPQPQSQHQSQPQHQSQYQTQPQHQTQPQPQSQHQSQPQHQSQYQTQPQHQTQPQPQSQHQPQPQTQSLHQTQPQPQPRPQPQPTISDKELLAIQKELGNQKYRNNLFDDAVRTYKRANELAKKLGDMEMSAIIHFNLAMTYYKLGLLDQAADECANAVKINDQYKKAHIKRAEIYMRQKKFDEAVICYEHLCELEETNRDYAILLHTAREHLKKTPKRDSVDILGLPKNFTKKDLKKTYRQIALDHHPDRHSDADVVTRRIHEKKFKDATEANSLLQLRSVYLKE